MFTQYFSFSLREVENLSAPTVDFKHFSLNTPDTLEMSVSGSIMPRISDEDTVLVVLSKELSVSCKGLKPNFGRNVTVFFNDDTEWDLNAIREVKPETIEVIPFKGKR